MGVHVKDSVVGIPEVWILELSGIRQEALLVELRTFAPHV